MAQEVTVFDTNKFLDFDTQKTQRITLDQLERTEHEDDVYGNPLKGIYHFQLVQEIIRLCNEQNYNVEIYDMFAAQNRDRNTPGVTRLPKIERNFGEKAVEAHILRRVFTNIRITDFDDDTYTTNLAVGYHQKGIQVGYGNMVKFCHNQMMLNAQQYASTYSDKGRLNEKMDIPSLLDVVKSWLVDARHIVVEERERIERMKQIQVSAEQMYTLIGMLVATRVACDTTEKELRENRVYPLNNTQINAFTEDMLLRYKRNNRVTVWDMYDGATELYKADRMDIPNLLPQNRAFVNFLSENFEF